MFHDLKRKLWKKILALDDSQTSTTSSIKDLVNSIIDDIEARKKRGLAGIKTYLDGLDAYLAGIQPTDLMIIAARPAMGKTALGLQIALNNAVNKKKVYFVTLEMGREQLIERMLVNLTGIDGKRMKLGDLKNDEYLKLARQSARLSSSELVIDELSNTVAAIRSQARKLKAMNGLDLIVVDYLQILDGTGENRVEQVTSISRGLKQLARELKTPVIALSQLNRANESLKEKRPMLSHLRESGAIEQDADIVLFIHREDYYREKANDPKRDGISELIIAKHRNGPTGIVRCNYEASTMKFYHDWVMDAMALEAQKEMMVCGKIS